MGKILVTGATGLLGSTLVPYLRAQKHEVLSLARSGPVDLLCDLSNAVEAGRTLGSARPDVVVNLAGLTNVDSCEEKPQQAFLANVQVVQNISNWVTANPSALLIQVSTDQVYDGVGPHQEDHICLSNVYAFSKFAGELLAQKAGATVLRTTFVGRSRSQARASLSDWIVNSLRKRASIKVFTDVAFTPLSIATLCTALETVVLKRIPGVYNLGSRTGASKAEFAFSLAKALDLPAHLMTPARRRDEPSRAYRPTDMRMDSSRFERVFDMRLPDLAQELSVLKEEYL